MKDWKRMTAGDAMSSPVITVDLGTSVGDVADLLDERKIGGALVVDLAKTAVGVVSKTDLAHQVAEERFGGPPAADVRVEDVMTSRVFSVEASTPLREVARVMTERQVHRLFVTREGEPVGIITTLDLLRLLANS